MNRRGFIGGMVAALTGGGEALIRLANPAEQSLIRAGDPTTVVAAHNLRPADVPSGSSGQFYLAMIGPEGIKHEVVGFARDFMIESRVDCLDVTSFGGTVEHYVARGLRTGDVQLSWQSAPDDYKLLI